MKVTHLILAEEQLIDPDHPASTFVKRLRAAILNGPKRTIAMYPNAAIPLKELTDEQIELFQRWGTTLLLDGENSLLSLGAKMDVRGYNDPIFIQKNRELAQLKADAENASLRLWPRNKIDPSIVDPDSVPTSMEIFNGLTKNDGTVSAGRDSNNNWQTTMNKIIQWTDSSGVLHTINNGIHANDYHTDSVGSFRTKFAQIDTLVATKASIQQLEAVEATVGTLNAKIANVEELVASKATISEVYSSFASSKNVQIGGLVCDTGMFSTLSVGGHTCKWTVLKFKDWTGTNQAYSVLIHS